MKYLKYPPKEQIDKSREKRVKYTITFITIVMLVPSAWLAYSLYREQQFKKNAEAFINSEFVSKGYTIVYKKTDFKTNPKMIEVAFLSKRFTTDELEALEKTKNKNFYLKGAYLHIRQDSIDRLINLRRDILEQIKSGESQLNEKDVQIFQLENKLKEYEVNSTALFKEASILFPQLKSLSVGKQNVVSKDTAYTVTTAIY